jgi:hypothetical protein
MIGKPPAPTREELEAKGRAGENAMQIWLNTAGLGYLYINQSIDTFATMFSGTTKRPDFLVLLDSIGIIAVDVKNHKLSDNCYALPLQDELEKVLTFERLFRIPVWYAYLGNEEKWHWISALKAIEVGMKRQNEETKKEYIKIPLTEFVIISKNDDLGKLYTQRLTLKRK